MVIGKQCNTILRYEKSTESVDPYVINNYVINSPYPNKGRYDHAGLL